jgi:hypothetical protein
MLLALLSLALAASATMPLSPLLARQVSEVPCAITCAVPYTLYSSCQGVANPYCGCTESLTEVPGCKHLSRQHKHHLVPLLRCYRSQRIRNTLQVSDPGVQQPHFRRQAVLPQVSHGRGISELRLSVRCHVRRRLLCVHGNEGAHTGGFLAPEFALVSSTSLCKCFSIDGFWANGHRRGYVCSS